MPIRVAVYDPLPAYRHGIMATLGNAGFQPEDPPDLVRWALEAERQVVLLTLESDADWTTLAELRTARPELLLVAVVAETSVQAQVRAVTAGAVATIRRDATPETVQKVLEAAVAGVSLLPIEVVRAFAAHRTAGPDTPAISDREVEWLRDLARGVTVAQLAERSGYSERAMFRLLKHLYQRMKVHSRTEALIYAQQQGWL
jgi:DNA-binding NarL/FixJ family response regulator